MSERQGDAKEQNTGSTDLAEENARLREELARLKASAADTKRADRGRWRRIATPILIVLTCVSLVATTVGVWVNRTVWNNGKYLSTVVPLADDPAIIEALATKLTDQAFVALDVQRRVNDALASLSSSTSIPPQVTFLAAPITASLKNVIHDRVVTSLKSDTFQTYWATANEQLHPKIVALLKGDYSQLPNVTVGQVDVQLDLLPILTQVLRDLVQSGVGSLNIDVTIPEISAASRDAALQTLANALGVSLPQDFGKVTIMSSASLKEYQDAANRLRILGWGLLGLTALLIVLTIAVSATRRRTIAWMGAGSAGAIVIATVILRRIVQSIVASISAGEARNAAQAVVAQFGGSLKHAGRLVGWTCIVIAVVAYLLGRPAWLVGLVAWVRSAIQDRRGGRQIEDWFAAHTEGARMVGIAVAVLVLFITGIDWLPVIIIGGLLALYLWGISAAQRRRGGTPMVEG